MRAPRPCRELSLATVALLAHARCAHAPEAAPERPVAPEAEAPASSCRREPWVASAGDGARSPHRACAATYARLRGGGDVRLRDADEAVLRVCDAWRCVGRMLARDLAARDVIAVNCRGDKFAQLGASLDGASARREALGAALDAGDEARARHERSVLAVFAGRAEALVTEADQCIGGGLARVTPWPASPRRGKL